MLTLERIKSLPRGILYNDYRVLLAEFIEKGANEHIVNGFITLCIDPYDPCYLSIESWLGLILNKSYDITKYFTDWLNPTPEENTLWTLETGLEPIETYVEQMEKLMKETK